MKDRAVLPYQKRDLIERVLSVWIAMPDMRLGQLIVNAATERCKSPLFWAEDAALCNALEQYAEKHGRDAK